MPECLVSFLDIDGLRHAVEVEATTLYEAAVLAICKFNEHGAPRRPKQVRDRSEKFDYSYRYP
jgi:hypothetical protein